MKNRITIIAIIFQFLALLYAIFKGYEDVIVMIIIFLFISTLDLFNKIKNEKTSPFFWMYFNISLLF